MPSSPNSFIKLVIGGRISSNLLLMKKIIPILVWLITAVAAAQAQNYHSVATFSYAAEGLYAKVIKANPVNPKIIYMGAQHVNLSYKGFFDTYDLTQPDTVKRVKRMGLQTDSFGVTDFVFRGTDIYAIGSRGSQIINASTPANPIFTKNINTYKDGTTSKGLGYMTASILIEGNRMHYGGSNYYLLDISNLNSLTKLAERSYSGINSGSIQQLSSNKVLVGDGYNVNIFDVSSPPTVVKTVLTSLYGDPRQLLYDKQKKILYTTSGTSSQNFVYSVDMNTNNQLDSFNYASVPGFDPASHSGICLFKDTLYVGTSLGVALFDVSNPANLKFLGRLSTGGSNAVFVNEEYLITNDNYNFRFYRRGLSGNSVDEQLQLSQFVLYPNPTQDKAYLIFNNSVKPSIKLRDESGRLIKEWASTESAITHEIPLLDLKSGTYLIEIKVDERSESKKLVIQ